MLLLEFLISLAILIPVSIYFGVLYSFRYCGPLYRFKKFVAEYPEGRWDAALTLRQGDQLQDLKDGINECLDSLKVKIHSQQDTLQKLGGFLEKLALEPSLQEEAREHLRLIEAEARHFDAKLGKSGAATAAGSQVQSVSPPREEHLEPA
jgi:hypothetical protein